MNWKVPAGAMAAAMAAAPLLSGQNSPSAPANPYEGEIQVVSYPYSPAEAKIQVKSSLIDIGVVVRDKNGKPVGGLKKEDFSVFDNGKLREITNFSVLRGNEPEAAAKENVSAAASSDANGKPAAAPGAVARYVGFFFDDLNMEPASLIAARKAAQKYVAAPLESAEKVGIFTTSGYVTADFTSDVSTLQATLTRVLPRPRRPGQTPLSCPKIGPYQAYQIETDGGTLQLSQAFQLAYTQAVQCHCVFSSRQAAAAQNDPCAQTEIKDVQQLARQVLDRSTDVARDTLRSLFGVIRYMAKFQGRRSIVMASDGFFTQNVQLERDRVIDTAAQARIAINTIDAGGIFGLGMFNDGNANANLPHDPSTSANGARMDLVSYGTTIAQDEASYSEDVLSAFAEGTGGTFFHNNNDINRGVKELAAAPDVSYSLAISGDNLKSDGSFHSLKIKAAGAPGAAISARRGYFAPSGNPPPDPAQIMRNMVLGSEELNAVPVALDVQQLKPAENVSGLKVGIRVDLKKLPYRNNGERRDQRILFVSALLDTKGNFLTGVAGEINMKMKAATLKKIEPQGADARLSLQAPPGQYKLREIVREGVRGKFTATTREVTIQ